MVSIISFTITSHILLLVLMIKSGSELLLPLTWL